MFKVTVYLEGKKDTYKNVVNFGPIPERDLLAVTLETGETIVYPFRNIKKYSYKIEV